MQVKETPRFRKSFDSLDGLVKKKFVKQFKLFLSNLFHPSLNTEKLQPKEKNIWSFRLDKNYRVIFTFEGSEMIVLLDVGPHDIYRKK